MADLRAGDYRSLHEIRLGEYVALALAEGFESAEEPVEILPGQTTEHSLILRPTHPLEGGIIGGVRGGPSWEGSVPLPGAHVVLIAGVDPADAGPVRETETDCDGRFHFFNLEPGPYFLVAEARGFQPERATLKSKRAR